jgi:hypothetical protein
VRRPRFRGICRRREDRYANRGVHILVALETAALERIPQRWRKYGDAEWIDALIEAGRDADLFIAECYTYDRKVRFHLDYATLKEELPRINANV